MDTHRTDAFHFERYHFVLNRAQTADTPYCARSESVPGVRADEDVMHQPPRPVGESVLTPRMWRGIIFVGVVMAAGTLIVLDAALPGGYIEGSGDLRYGQTMAFTTLMLFQVFNVFNARSDDQSAFARLFTNAWLWAAITLSLALRHRGPRAISATRIRHGRSLRRRLAVLFRGCQCRRVAEGNLEGSRAGAAIAGLP